MSFIFKNNDLNTPISFFRNKVDDFVKERNWKDYHTPKNLVQALNCEAGELSQLLLFKDYNKNDIIQDKGLLNNLADEIADVFIYLISLTNVLDLDLTRSFINKMSKNNKKYSIEEFNDGSYYKK